MSVTELLYQDEYTTITRYSASRQPVRRATLVIYGFGAGGAERSLLRLAEWLQSHEWATTVVTLNPGVADFYQPAPGVVRVGLPISLSLRPAVDLFGHARDQLRLRRAILATRPHVVVSFLTDTNIRVLAALLGRRVPVVVSERVHPPSHSLPSSTRALRRLLYPAASRIVLVSSESLPWARERWKGCSLTSIPNAVLPPVADENVPKPGWLRSPVVVGMGRLDRQKGFDVLISAFASLADQFPEWQLAIVGEGAERENLELQARRAGIASRVILPGVTPSPEAVFAHADLFVLPSRYEGFPGVLAEAMASGAPVIASDCPGSVRQLIRDGVDGLIVAQDSVDELAKAMGELMSDGSRRAAMGVEARFVCERFSLELVMTMWEDCLADAVRAAPRTRRDIVQPLLRG